MTELLSCPFCGGRAAAGRTYNGETTLFKVQCMSCPAAMKGYDQSVADAIDAWNTRAAPARCDAEPDWADKLASAHGFYDPREADDYAEALRRKATPPSRSDAESAALRKALEEILACGSDHELHEAFIRARAALSPDPGTVTK